MSKVGLLPSCKVIVSLPSSVLRAPPTPQSAIPHPFTGPPLISVVTASVACRPGGVSPVPRPTLPTFRSPYAGGFFSSALPGSSSLPWPSPPRAGLGSLLVPFGKNYGAAGFASCCGLPDWSDTASTLGLLLTPGGSYRAAWPLPPLDFHQLAGLSLAGRDARHSLFLTPKLYHRPV